MSSVNNIVIVGASLAGSNAASALRRQGYEGSITLIGDEPGLPYDRPPLSKAYLAGEAAESQLALFPEVFYADNAIDLRSGHRATRLRPDRGVVELADGAEVGADRVLLTTGGRPRTLRIPGADLDGILVLRTLEDARQLREQLEAAASVSILGGGLIGAEVASTIVQMGKQVAVFEQADEILSNVLGSPVSEILTIVHRDHGVELHTNCTVTRILGNRRVEALELDDGRVHPTDLLLVAIGVIPNDELALSASIECSNGIVVDHHGRTSNPSVYAAGDVAMLPLGSDGTMTRREHWRHALNHGVFVAEAMLGATKTYADVPWFWSHQYEYDIQAAGQCSSYDDLVVRGDIERGSFCVFYRTNAVVTGAVGLNAARDIRGALEVIRLRTALTVDELTDTSLDLRRAATASRN